MEANPEIKDGNIKIGQKIKIPKKGNSGTVSTRKENNADDDAVAKKNATKVAAKKVDEVAKKPINHKVSDGENLTKIAKRYDVSVQELKRHNNITGDNKLRSGSTLKIPKKGN